jgi:F-type H+-transporting ATPase subunit epsilon
MSDLLHLVISTPDAILADRKIRALRAQTHDGAFGIWPGHTDLVATLPPSVLHLENEDGHKTYCALRNGVLLVSKGAQIDIACREALLGDNLPKLEAQVLAMRTQNLDARRRAQVEQTRLHAKAIRQMILRLHSRSGWPDRAAAQEI